MKVTKSFIKSFQGILLTTKRPKWKSNCVGRRRQLKQWM